MTTIGVTCGDINGIGPEVSIKALRHEDLWREVSALLIGPARVYEYWAERIGWHIPLQIVEDANKVNPEEECLWVYQPIDGRSLSWDNGGHSAQAGRIAGRAMEAAIRFAMKGDLAAIVTAPLSKKALNHAGYNYPGMTELLADRTGTRNYAMMLIGGDFRVALVTTHCALSEVPGCLSTEQVLAKIEVIHNDLQRRFGIPEPRIAVCALNPHRGEGGLFGREELDIIDPAIALARASGINVTGAHPADALFARHREDKYDAYLAMYHDQGLIPLKVLHFGRSVNYTAGLPFIRTSPDHGTAFDIAGKGVANESSMVEAIRLASQLAQKKASVAG